MLLHLNGRFNDEAWSSGTKAKVEAAQKLFDIVNLHRSNKFNQATDTITDAIKNNAGMAAELAEVRKDITAKQAEIADIDTKFQELVK